LPQTVTETATRRRQRMSKTMSIAASTTWGPERKHLAAVVAALVGVAWALSFAAPAQARVILDDTSVREARSYDLSSLQASIRADGVPGTDIEAVRAQSYRFEAPVARTDIEAVRAQNYRFEAQTQESMLPQEAALREAAQFEAPVAGTDIEAVRAQNYRFEAPYDGAHAATLGALSDPSYGHPQPERDFTPLETQVAEIDDGVNVGLLTAVTVGLLGVALLVGGMRHRRGVSPA
jgi:hypothetical protein